MTVRLVGPIGPPQTGDAAESSADRSRLGLLGRHWPLPVAFIALWSVTGILLIMSVAQNDGHLVYALDDAYIHMSMAKNLALHGIWGVTPYGFSSSSSSLLWTLILAGLYSAVGVSEVTPLVLNVGLATLMVAVTYLLLSRSGARQSSRLLVLLGIMVVTPLPLLVLSGMEHILHALVVIGLAYSSAVVVSTPDTREQKVDGRILLALAPIAAMVRYESLFLVATIVVLLLIRRRWLFGVSFLVLAGIPVTVYGVLSMNQGWFLLPNSVLLKSSAAQGPSWEGLGSVLAELGIGWLRILLMPEVLILTVVAPEPPIDQYHTPGPAFLWPPLGSPGPPGPEL